MLHDDVKIHAFAMHARTANAFVHQRNACLTQRPELCASHDGNTSAWQRIPLHTFYLWQPPNRDTTGVRMRPSSIVLFLSLLHTYTWGDTSTSGAFRCRLASTRGKTGSRFAEFSVSCCAPTCRDVFAHRTVVASRRYLNSLSKVELTVFMFCFRNN